MRHDVSTVLSPPGDETLTTSNNAAQDHTLKLQKTSAKSCTDAESDTRCSFQSETTNGSANCGIHYSAENVTAP